MWHLVQRLLLLMSISGMDVQLSVNVIKRFGTWLKIYDLQVKVTKTYLHKMCGYNFLLAVFR